MTVISLLPLPTVNVAPFVNAGFSPLPCPVLHRIALQVVSGWFQIGALLAELSRFSLVEEPENDNIRMIERVIGTAEKVLHPI